MHLKRINKDERDQEEPRRMRAVIYLQEPTAEECSDANGDPSIARQRALCRQEARRLGAEVLGEFVDVGLHRQLRPGLHVALETAQQQRLDYLIVTSLDHLFWGPEDTVEVAWRLGHAGTFPIPAYEGD